MAKEVKLPRLGQGMEEGKILSWLKAEGETVSKGDDLYEVETEKVNVEVESPADGTVLKLVAKEGDTIAIGSVIAWIGEPGEVIPSTTPEPIPAPTPAESAPAPSSAPKATTLSTPNVPKAADNRLKASPLARRMASEQGIELSSVAGSGPDGRIVARDITPEVSAGTSVVLSQQPEAGHGIERIELTSMRRTIARRLGEAWEAPAFYLSRDIDMTEANVLRKRMLERVSADEVRPTVSDIITKAAAVALREHPDMNVHFAGDAILRFESVHIGLAVATDIGLVVPVIRDAHTKTVREIAKARKVLVDNSRIGALQPVDFEGGTFTISNLGMMGIDEFTAVLNPPMAGILAVGATVDRPVAIDRKVEIRPIMKVTLGCDHRTVDGAVGARFLDTFVRNIEDPLSMI